MWPGTYYIRFSVCFFAVYSLILDVCAIFACEQRYMTIISGIEIPSDEVSFENVIGEGAFGKVYKG